jgi:hypothetical protein
MALRACTGFAIVTRAFLVLFLIACGQPVEPTPAPRDPPPRPEQPAQPIRPATPLAPIPVAPGTGCAFGEPVQLAEHAGSIALCGGPSITAVIGGASLRIVRIADDVGVLLDEATPTTSAAIAGDTVAIVDAEHRVRLRAGSEWKVVGEGASTRFDLALARASDRWAIAWTDERSTPMRVRARIVDAEGTGDPAQDLTPPGSGAAAPRFVRGSDPPVLVFIDPRAAISVVHGSTLSNNTFGTARVLRPVSNAAEPPEIAAVHIGDADWIAFTAVGSIAMTAVGLVRAGDQAAPIPIVPGRGYGPLHVDVEADGARAIFAADSPLAAPPTSPREIAVRILRDGALSDAIPIRGSNGEASHARIARADDGRIAIGFLSGGSAYAAIGRCAD